MSISFNELNGTTVSDASGNTTLGTLSSQNPNTQNLNNTAVGYGALRDNAGGQHNIAVGLNALANNSASNNVAIGENALYNFSAPATQTGTLNVAVGNNAIQSNVSGSQNVAVGNQALHNNTTGNYNAVVGNGAAYYNTTGRNNAVLGANALLNNTTGTQNVAIGKEALQTAQTTSGNVAVGHHALKNNTTGNGNIGIGNHAFNSDTGGSNNVGIGSSVSANSNDSCILLGNGAQTVVSNEIGIGGINLATASPAPSITGYLPVRVSNSTLSNKLYYVPMCDPTVPQVLPIPEVIIANHSSISGGAGGVGLLIGFPAGYAAVSSVTIANGGYSVVINSPISVSGYYVYYEKSDSGFWNNLLPSTYSNLAQAPIFDATLCGGLVFGNTLVFTYVLASVSTKVTYQPTPTQQLDIGDGYQFQQYNGASATPSNAGFQWGRKPGGGGSESWGTQSGSGTQTYTQWLAVASPVDYQYNSIYKYLYPYSSVSGPGPAPAPGPSATMTWLVNKSLSSIANGATYTIGGTDIPAPTTTGSAAAITYSILCDSNTPSITTSGTNGAILTAVWTNWGAPANGFQTNGIITATQGANRAYLNVVITVSDNALTWAFSQYNLLTAPMPYATPAALTFSPALSTYYTTTPAFTVSNTYTNVIITSSASSVATATTTSGTTTITPLTAGSTIITATYNGLPHASTRTLLTIAAPAGPTVVSMYSQMTNPSLSSNLSIAPNAIPPSQQFIANESGNNLCGIIDYFFIPLIQFINVPNTTNVQFTMTLAKNGTTLITTTFTLNGNAGTTYANGINIPFLSQSAASNTPPITFTFNPASPTSTNTTITNLDQITISLNATSTITVGNWQIKMSGGEMAGTVYGTSQTFIDKIVPSFTPASLSTTFADVAYTPNLGIPFTLVSSNTITPLTYTITPSDMGTISEIANSGGGPSSYRFNALKAGTATITFNQAAYGGFLTGTITGTLRVLTAPTITFTSVVSGQIELSKSIIYLNITLAPAATSTNTIVAMTYALTGVDNISGTTNPCATITSTGTGAATTYALNLLGFGSFTLVASQLAANTYTAGTASLPITIVPGAGPSNTFALKTIAANASTAPFVMDLLVNSMNSVSMSYTTNINAVVSYFNIPKFNVKIDNVSTNQNAQFTLTVYRGATNIPVSTTTFSIYTDSSGVYSPTNGITVPLSVGASGLSITPGLTVVSVSQAGQTQLYAIQSPLTAYSISTTNPNVLIVLTPSTNFNYGSVTVDVNANGPNSGMLGTLYGYIQLLSPELTIAAILTPITWTSSKQVSFNPASSSATDGISLTYASSNTNVATIPVTTTNSMTLTATKPTNPTNIITIKASRAATATYSQQTVSINPTTTPPSPICINTYALTNAQKIAYTNPISQIMSNVANHGTLYITFIASESFTSLDSLNFAINGGRYGYSNMFPTDVTPYFQIQISINDQPYSTIIMFTMKSTNPNSPNSYDSDLDGTLREIPFSQLVNYPTNISNFTVTGTPPSCVSGDKIKISIFCNVNWFISANGQGVITSTIVGTPSIPSASYPLPKILYMTSSSQSLTSSSVNSNTFTIFKKSVITSFQVAGVKPQGQFQSFYLNTQQSFYSASVGYSIYVSLSIAFTYDFGANYATTFSSIQIPFSNIEYSRLYPTSNPPMTSFTIAVGTNSGGAQSVPTPFLFNISDQFACTLVAAVSGQQFTANVLGNSMSGSIYGYEILSNPNLRNFNTLITPLNYLSTNYNKPIPPPGTDMSSPTFTYSVTSNGGVAIGTGANSNNLVLSNEYCNATVTVVESETNQYFTSALSQNVDIISRTMFPPGIFSMTTIGKPPGVINIANNLYQYVNVFLYDTSATIPLYGYGFFNIGSSDINFYSASTGIAASLSFNFIISKYQNGYWTTVRTMDIGYRSTTTVNSNDDGSLFIIPFYKAFSTGAPTYLPFRTLPSNIERFTVTANDSSDANLPPIFNAGDTIRFQIQSTSVNYSLYLPTDPSGQLSGTAISSLLVSQNRATVLNYDSYSNKSWTSVTPTNHPSFNCVPYRPPRDLILTGIYIYPMIGVPADANFNISIYLEANVFMTISGKTNVANAFNGYTNIWCTMTPDYPNPNISITNVSVVNTLSFSWLNKGLTGSEAVSTNPWVANSTNIFFQITFTNLGSSLITVQNYVSGGTTIDNIPGMFYGRLL